MFVPEFGRERVVGVGDLDLSRVGAESDEGGGSSDACVMMSAWLSVFGLL